MFSASCVDFGISGSGIAREWKAYTNGPAVDGIDKDPQYQYSFVGPLSMSKGCDQTLSIVTDNRQPGEGNDEPIEPEFIFRGKQA